MFPQFVLTQANIFRLLKYKQWQVPPLSHFCLHFWSSSSFSLHRYHVMQLKVISRYNTYMSLDSEFVFFLTILVNISCLFLFFDAESMNRPYCPSCNCCKETPPAPCCYCACYVHTNNPQNAAP